MWLPPRVCTQPYSASTVRGEYEESTVEVRGEYEESNVESEESMRRVRGE